MSNPTLAFHLHPGESTPATRAADLRSSRCTEAWCAEVVAADTAVTYLSRGRAYLDVLIERDSAMAGQWHTATVTVVYCVTGARLVLPCSAGIGLAGAVEAARDVMRTAVLRVADEVVRRGERGGLLNGLLD